MEIIIYVYDGLTALDAIGPYEVLSRLPQAQVKFVAMKRGPVTTDTRFLTLLADHDLSQVNRADLLLIPGSTISFIKEAQNKALLDWIRQLHQTTTWTTSVCSGSVILAAAGLLKGLQATSHWGATHLLNQYGAQPVAKRYVQQGKLVTAAGVSTGIDMALFLVGQIAGEQQAKAQQLVIEYDPKPPFMAGNAQQVDEATKKLAQKIMTSEARRNLTALEMVRYAPALMKLKHTT